MKPRSLFWLVGALWASAKLSAFPLWLDSAIRTNPNDPRSSHYYRSPTPIIPSATPTPFCPSWDFEAGATQGWQLNTNSGQGQAAFTSIASTSYKPHDGVYSLAISTSLSSAQSYGQVYNFGSPLPANLTGKTLLFWLYVPSGISPAQAYVNVQCTSSYTWYQSGNLDLPTGGGWVAIRFPLSSFTGNNQPIPASAQADVRGIGLWVKLNSTIPWTGTLYLDSVDIGMGCQVPTSTPVLSATPTAPGNPTATLTAASGSPTITPTPASGSPTSTPTAAAITATPTVSPTGPVWNFDDGTLQGWVNSTGDTGFTSVVSNTTMPHDGSNSLAMTCNLVQGGSAVAGVIYYNPPSTLDLTGKTLTAWVYVPAGMSNASNPTGAYIYVKTGSAWTWNQGPWQNLPSTAGWTQLSYNLNGVTNINDVREIGVKVNLGGSSPNWTGTIYIDSITY